MCITLQYFHFLIITRNDMLTLTTRDSLTHVISHTHTCSLLLLLDWYVSTPQDSPFIEDESSLPSMYVTLSIFIQSKKIYIFISSNLQKWLSWIFITSNIDYYLKILINFPKEIKLWSWYLLQVEFTFRYHFYDFFCCNILLSTVKSVFMLYGVKLVLGAPCIIVLLICKWGRKHLSMYDIIEDYLCSDNSIMPLRYSLTKTSRR